MDIDWRGWLPVWWSFFWRLVLYGALLGLALGFVGGMIAAVLGVPEEAERFGSIAGFIAYVPASMLAVKHALGRHLASLATLEAAASV